MYVLTKDFNGSVLTPIETKLSAKRIIFVEGDINSQMADEFAKQMMYLAMEDDKEPIKLLINSGGGEIDAGLKMCDVVSECPCRVDAYCFGKAYSMAAVLFESVNGRRNMVGHSKLMLHQPSVSGLGHGTASEVEELSRQLSEKNELLLSMVSKKCALSVEELKKETVKDRYYDADEAVEKNLADKMVTFADVINGNKEISNNFYLAQEGKNYE